MGKDSKLKLAQYSEGQEAERKPRPLQRDRQDDGGHCWGQTNSLVPEGELKVPALDLCDRFHDNVLHDEEDGSRRERNLIKDKTRAL